MNEDTELSEEQLRQYLIIIRKIALLDDAEAIIQIDKMIDNILDDIYGPLEKDEEEIDDESYSYSTFLNLKPAYSIEDGRHNLLEFMEALKDNINTCGASPQEHYWESEIDYLGTDWSTEVRNALESHINKAKEEAKQLLLEAIINEQGKQITECQNKPLYNITSTYGTINTLNHIESVLKSHGVFKREWEERIRNGKICCARFRSNKKIAEAEIASKIGNKRKAAVLLNEAQVILEKDWQEVFPEEKCPSIQMEKES